MRTVRHERWKGISSQTMERIQRGYTRFSEWDSDRWLPPYVYFPEMWSQG